MTTYVGTGRKGPNETKSFTIDFATYLAVMQDTIVDCDAFGTGVEVENRWFTETDASGTVSGGADGSYGALTLRVYCASGEVYERAVKIAIKS